MHSNRFNIAIIGAARRHQGTGPYIARRLHDLGHRICGFIGSGNDSIIQTRQHLFQWAGIDCEGYCSLQELCRKQAVDIVVICSPTHTHHEFILQAIEHDCHVLVEKPWIWTDQETALPEFARALLRNAEQRGKLIYMIAQWPFTLPYFRMLHPQASFDASQISQFGMQLSPASTGAAMLLDSISHPLSLLYTLLGLGHITAAKVSNLQHTGAEQMRVQFDYKHSNGSTRVTIDLTHTHDTIKPAGYCINEHSVHREVSLPDYDMKLCCDRRTLSIPDPMHLCLDDFFAHLLGRLHTDQALLMQHVQHTRQLFETIA